MQLATRTGTMTLAALGVAALAIPLTAGAATGVAEGATAAASDQFGNLKVCISDLRGNEAEIRISNRRTYRERDNDGGCTTFRDLRRGSYRIVIDTPRRCDDARGRVSIGSGTTRVDFDADCRSRDRDHDRDDDDDFYVTTRENCKDNGDDPVRTLDRRDDRRDDMVLCRED